MELRFLCEKNGHKAVLLVCYTLSYLLKEYDVRQSVKEFFNNLDRREKNELRENHLRHISRRLGYMPDMDFNVPDINQFDHFIECEISPLLCPMRWEDLEVDFKDKDKRFCEICQQYVYQVDNAYMLKQLKEENKCIAISEDLVQKLSLDMEQNLSKRLVISKLFLIIKRYKPNHFEYLKENDLSYEEMLKKTVWVILQSDNVEDEILWYIQRGIDMRMIFEEVLPLVDDTKLHQLIKTKLSKMLYE